MNCNAKLRFSIIVPVYNTEKYLPACVNSIMNQTFSDFELILVDDGSTDSSPSICDSCETDDERVSVIHKKNGGVVSARHTGFDRAAGEYIVCIDGDDWIEPDYLSAFNEQIEKYHPDMVCCGYMRSNPKASVRVPMPERKGFYSRRDIKNEVFPSLIQTEHASFFLPTLYAKAIRRQLLQSWQLPEDCVLNIGEDGACVIPCVYHADSLVIMDDCLYHYRVNKSSLTKNRKPFRWNGPQLIAEHICRCIDINESDFSQQLDRKICHELFSVVTSHLFQHRSYKKLRDDVIEGIDRPCYVDAVSRARFDSLKARLMQYCLSHKLISVIWLYSKVKHF